MTQVYIHGILAREYGDNFKLSLPNPKNVLEAIDCNRKGFISRIIELHKEGLCYDIIIDKKRISSGEEMEGFNNPNTIDLVPAITGAGFLAPVFAFLGSGTLLANLATAVIFAAISYALTPKPEFESLEIEADASKSSLIFSNTVNVASQGSPVPIGYGRLKVGSQVIQATIKSVPQHQTPQESLGAGGNPVFVGNRLGIL